MKQLEVWSSVGSRGILKMGGHVDNILQLLEMLDEKLKQQDFDKATSTVIM